MTHEGKAAHLLFRAYGAQLNAVTPCVLARVLVAPHVAAELSYGIAHDSPVWGVSVAIESPDGSVRRSGTSRDEPLRSSVYFSREAADERIRELGLLTATSSVPAPGVN
jgi:hypothetical protein